MKDLKELLGAKKKIDPIEKDAKLAAIKGMRKMAGDMISDDIKGMQKVTVAAPDKTSLEAGLEKAQDVLKHSPDMEEMSEMEEETPEQELEEVVDLVETPEEIDKLMAKLAEKKAALSKG